MTSIEKAFWSTRDQGAQVAIAQIASPHQLRSLSCRYDWSHNPEAVLGWLMAQKSIDLGTALTVFFNGEPERFNYMPKRDVPDEFRCAARVLDNICLRVNSGYYLIEKPRKLRCRDRLVKWLEYQKADRLEARRGRWILDEEIVCALISGDESDPARVAADPELEIEKFSEQPTNWDAVLLRFRSIGGFPRRFLQRIKRPALTRRTSQGSEAEDMSFVDDTYLS